MRGRKPDKKYKKLVKCETCGKSFLRYYSRIKKNIYCSTKCADKGYRKIYTKENHHNWKGIGKKRYYHPSHYAKYKVGQSIQN